MIRTLYTFLFLGLSILSFGQEQELDIDTDRTYLLSYVPVFQIAIVSLVVIVLIVVIFRVRRSKRRAKQAVAKEKLQHLGDESMMAYEEVEPLTDHDRLVLRREYIILGVVLSLFALIPFSFLALVDPDDRPMLFVMAIPWVSVVAFLGIKSFEKKQEILRTGTKNVLRGIVTDRFYKYPTSKNASTGDRETSAIPHLRIGDRELWVSWSIFRSYDVGDAVELHYCNNLITDGTQSNTFFAARKIEGAGVMETR